MQLLVLAARRKRGFPFPLQGAWCQRQRRWSMDMYAYTTATRSTLQTHKPPSYSYSISTTPAPVNLRLWLASHRAWMPGGVLHQRGADLGPWQPGPWPGARR
jgi:hypothetical protein